MGEEVSVISSIEHVALSRSWRWVLLVGWLFKLSGSEHKLQAVRVGTAYTYRCAAVNLSHLRMIANGTIVHNSNEARKPDNRMKAYPSQQNIEKIQLWLRNKQHQKQILVVYYDSSPHTPTMLSPASVVPPSAHPSRGSSYPAQLLQSGRQKAQTHRGSAHQLRLYKKIVLGGGDKRPEMSEQEQNGNTVFGGVTSLVRFSYYFQ